MAIKEIAVEIGTSYTSVYVPGNGIVLREPTVIAFFGDPRDGRVQAVGAEAEKMLGKTPERTVIVQPVADGLIVDADACVHMLRTFLRRILPQGRLFAPRVKAIVGVPVGLTVQDRALYGDVCEEAGIGDVVMVENILLSAVGLDLPVVTAEGGIVVNIGAGVTEIAAVGLSSIVSGFGITIGGNKMDKAVADYIAGKYDLKVGLRTARKVKNEIGSLYENDTANMLVSGRNVSNRNTGSAYITAAEVCEVVKPYYQKIAEAIESAINLCPPDIVGDVSERGIYVVGGGSKILGLEKTYSERLRVPVHTVEEPSYCAVLGAGKLLGDRQLFESITQKSW